MREVSHGNVVAAARAVRAAVRLLLIQMDPMLMRLLAKRTEHDNRQGAVLPPRPLYYVSEHLLSCERKPLDFFRVYGKPNSHVPCENTATAEYP